MSSKIKVDTIENVAGSGNVSLGSGHNLVVPGNLTVDTNTLHVNSSNNRVGVGTTSPNNPLEIAHTGSVGAGGLRIGDPSTIASDTGIYLRTTGDAVIGAAGGNIVFDTNMAVQEDMRIDSSGRVITPNQPSFKAQRSGSNTTSGTVVFNQTSHNIGNHYSTSTGRFTAPVAGRYLFSLVAMAQNDYFRGQIVVNSSGITQFRTDHDGAQDMNYMQATITVIYNLAANDYVFMQVDAGTAGGNTAEMQFYGHLLG